MRILIAPDKFKGTLTAAEAADAIAVGVRRVRPQAELELCPLADGGEGSGDVLAAALCLLRETTVALDPLGRPGPAPWWRSGDGALAFIELAAASGLQRLTPAERDPRVATSYGTGELIAAATQRGAREIRLFVGGSATIDGGAGILQALGWRYFTRDGREMPAPMRGGDLAAIARVAPPKAPSLGESPAGIAPLASITDRPVAAPVLTVYHDVENVLLGPSGAVAMYGRQKFAPNFSDWDAAARALEVGLENLVRVLDGAAYADQPGAGAAGGVGFGLACAAGARLLPAAPYILQAVDFAARLSWADLVLTGEGRFDATSAAGKLISHVAAAARAAGKPVIAFAGSHGFSGEAALKAAAKALELHVCLAMPANATNAANMAEPISPMTAQENLIAAVASDFLKNAETDEPRGGGLR